MRFHIPLIALILATAHAAEVETEQAQNDIAVLNERHVISSPDYWTEHVVTNGKCDGAKVAALLLHAAKLFRASAVQSEAIPILAERGIIGSPDYWTKRAVAGETCDGYNVSIVLNHIVARLPAKQAKALTAAPLEAKPTAQLQSRYDIVIAGAGTGGVGAAIQAARMGRSVLLLDETDWIGGQMNAAAVTSMDEGGTLCRDRGVYHELCEQIAAHYQPLGMTHETAYGMRHVCVEPRVGRHILHVMLGDAASKGTLDLSLRSRVIKVLKSANKVAGVEIEFLTDTGKTSRQIDSQVLIDATEWGDVIPLTGARYRVGNCINDAIDPSRHVQSNTWTAVVKQYSKGVPAELQLTTPPPGYTDKVHAAFVRSLTADEGPAGAKEKPWNWTTFIGYRGMPDSSRPGDAPPITRTHLNYNNDYPSTVAEIENPTQRQITNREMRLKTLHLLYYIQHTLVKSDWAVANDEGYDTPHNRAEIDTWLTEHPDLQPYRAILYHFSIIPYIRESRRIIGLHTLTASEIERKPRSPTLFANTVALGDYAVDLHGSMTPNYLELDLDHEEDIPHDKFGARGVGPFAIPFESFIPEKIDGFLPAEKNISQSRMANGATRLQPHTMLMGQAAGAIAALAVQRGIQPRAVNPVLVQDVLLDANDTLFVKTITDVRQDSPDWKPVQFSLARGLMQLDGRKFNAKAELSVADRELIVKQLGADCPAELKDNAKTIPRIEAACLGMKFLVKRAS